MWQGLLFLFFCLNMFVVTKSNQKDRAAFSGIEWRQTGIHNVWQTEMKWASDLTQLQNCSFWGLSLEFPDPAKSWENMGKSYSSQNQSPESEQSSSHRQRILLTGFLGVAFLAHSTEEWTIRGSSIVMTRRWATWSSVWSVWSTSSRLSSEPAWSDRDRIWWRFGATSFPIPNQFCQQPATPCTWFILVC